VSVLWHIHAFARLGASRHPFGDVLLQHGCAKLIRNKSVTYVPCQCVTYVCLYTSRSSSRRYATSTRDGFRPQRAAIAAPQNWLFLRPVSHGAARRMLNCQRSRPRRVGTGRQLGSPMRWQPHVPSLTVGKTGGAFGKCRDKTDPQGRYHPLFSSLSEVFQLFSACR